MGTLFHRQLILIPHCLHQCLLTLSDAQNQNVSYYSNGNQQVASDPLTETARFCQIKISSPLPELCGLHYGFLFSS